MTHVVIGYPTLVDTKTIVLQMAESGADFIELQIPFSDPLADGPTIMAANDSALANGVTIKDCFRFMEDLAKQVDIPLLFMGYYNIVFHVGVEQFIKRAKEAGCQGLIIPDIPADEEAYEQFIATCKKYDMHHIRLLSPTSNLDRIKLNASYENGFVYCTSRAGITGATNTIDPQLADFLRKVRKYVHIPIAVGFGISKREHVHALIGHADIAVIGSALIEEVKNHGVQSVKPFIESLTI